MQDSLSESGLKPRPPNSKICVVQFYHVGSLRARKLPSTAQPSTLRGG
jgi:hypothetical protein